MADNHAASCMYMGNLNQYCQKHQLRMQYKEVSIAGPPHDRRFTLVAVIEGREYTEATAKSKKAAKSLAAKLAWEAIQEEMRPALVPLQQPLPPPSPPPSQLLPCTPSLPDATSPLNCVSLLNEYAQKRNLIIDYIMKDKTGEDHTPHFFFECKIGDETYGEGTGKNKQTAKSRAAKQAYEKLMAQLVCSPSWHLMAQLTSRTEPSAASVNSQELSEEASLNGMDSDLECKGINGKLANKFGAMQLSEDSASTVESPRVPAVKSKRKGTPLAPTFSKLRERESKYTINKRFLNDFVDIVKIGGGGYGRVFKAMHAIDKRVCAVKRVKFSFDEEEKAKAQREVEVLAKLHHENIVQYYACWIGQDSLESEDSTSDNSFYRSSQCEYLFIVMEFCEKGTLEEWMNEKRRTKGCKEDSLMKFRQIVEGVEYIHSKHIIHRDLKPPNIFISKDDKIKIGDFGLVTSGDPSVLRTENRGTKTYMAPEQMRNNYGKPVDIYPLGLILFEMLYIFGTGTERAKEWANIKRCKFPQIFKEEFPTETSLVKKLLSENPDERPSATEILERLNQSTPVSLHTHLSVHFHSI